MDTVVINRWEYNAAHLDVYPFCGEFGLPIRVNESDRSRMPISSIVGVLRATSVLVNDSGFPHPSSSQEAAISVVGCRCRLLR